MRTSKHRWSPRVARTTLVALVASGALSAVALAATFNGNGGDNFLVGTPNADVMNGLGGSDVIHGNLGNDYIDGGTGNDFDEYGCGGSEVEATIAPLPCYVGLEGGSGNDRVSGGSGHDWIDGDGLNYFVCSSAGLAAAELDCGENAVPDSEAGADNLDGGNGDDHISGNPGNDTLIGGAGEDDLWGDNDPELTLASPGEGNDRIYARDGAPDEIWCGKGTDYVQYDKNIDILHKGNGDETFVLDQSDCEFQLTK